MEASDDKPLDQSQSEDLKVTGKKYIDSSTPPKSPNTNPEMSANIANSNSPSSSSASTASPTKAGDALFEPSIDMMVNDFDDESTLAEEEALAAKEFEDPNEELNDLQKESDMPIEELLALYNCNPPTTTSSSPHKKRKRRNESKPSTSSKKEKLVEKSKICPTEEVVEEVLEQQETAEIEYDEDETATTNTNNPESNIDDDTTNYDEEDTSELKKLYTENYEKKGFLRPDEEDLDDLEYIPDDDEESKKTIMVGSDYQAVIPEELCKYDDALPYENMDKLLWDPLKMNESDVEDYLNKIQSLINASINPQNGNNVLTYYTRSGSQHLRDDEQALFLLLQCGYNSDEALRRRRINSVVSSGDTPMFSEEECRNFESGLRLHGKSFTHIQQKVRTRSVGELVQFYYLWKKTERHDVFANKTRLEKKKMQINPCATDFMDKFLEDHEGGTRDLGRDRSASPNVNCLLYTDAKRTTRLDSSSSKNTKENLMPESSDKKQHIENTKPLKVVDLEGDTKI